MASISIDGLNSGQSPREEHKKNLPSAENKRRRKFNLHKNSERIASFTRGPSERRRCDKLRERNEVHHRSGEFAVKIVFSIRQYGEKCDRSNMCSAVICC